MITRVRVFILFVSDSFAITAADKAFISPTIFQRPHAPCDLARTVANPPSHSSSFYSPPHSHMLHVVEILKNYKILLRV